MKAVKAKVSLVRYTPDAEAIIASAAKICYASETEQAFDEQSASADFVKRLRKMGHLSPYEHAVFTFYIEGVSRALSHQLVRHRLASYSQRSQRYDAHNQFDYIIPPQLEGKTVKHNGRERDAVEFFQETMEYIAERYRLLNDSLGSSGESSNEDARYALPNACETKIVATMNARELLHFFEERLCLRAQWEIRGVAEEMLDRVKEIAPSVFDGSGPKCLRYNRCPEGKLSCGQFEQIKHRYGETL